MKTLLTLLVFSAGLLNSLADLRLYEPFNYTVGQGLSGQAGQTFLAGTTGGPSGTGRFWGQQAPNGNYWMSTGLSGTYDPLTDAVIFGDDLIVPGLYHPDAGGSVTLGGPGITPRIAFQGIANDTVNGSAQYAYYSLAFKIPENGLNGTAANGGLVAAFNNTRGSQSGNPTTTGCSLWVKASGGGFVVGVYEQGATAANAANVSYDPNVLSFGTTYFVVGKYTIIGTNNVNPTSDDTAKIWVNPLSATFGGLDPASGETVAAFNAVDVPTNAGDATTIQTFLLRQDAAVAGSPNVPQNIILDELRIGTTYADVTPVPEPGTTALALIGGLTILALGRFRSRK